MPPSTAAAADPIAGHASAGDPQTLTGRSGLVSYGALLLSLGSWCTQGFVYALQESLSPPKLWKFYNQILLTFRFPGDFQSLCQIPRLGSLMWCLEPSTVRALCYTFSPVCGHPSSSSMVGLMVTSPKRICATQRAAQDRRCQCPCPCGRSLLTHTSTGDPPTLTGRLVTIGSLYLQVCFILLLFISETPHVSENIQYLSFSVCLSIIFSKFIPVAENDKISLF